MSVKFDLNKCSVFFLQQCCWNTRVKAGFNWCSAFLTANTSCIRLSTSGQRSKRGEHNDVSSVQSSSAALMPPCRRADGRREGGGRGRKREGICNLQLFAMMTVANGSALHSSTWCSCKNSHPSQALTSERDNALLCFAGTSCEVSCLSDRKLPVMFQSCTLLPPPSRCRAARLKIRLFLCLPIYTIIIHGRVFLRSSSQYCRCRTASKCEIKKQMRILIGYLLLNYLLNHTLPKKDC